MGAIAAPLTILAVDLRAMAPRSTARAAGGPSACDRLPSPGSQRRGPLGRVAELADAQDSGSCGRKDVGVQVPPRPRSKGAGQNRYLAQSCGLGRSAETAPETSRTQIGHAPISATPDKF